MSVEVLDGATIREFVDDDRAFSRSIEARFATLDANHDGVLSFTEMVKELQSLRMLETHFGVDGDFKIDKGELARLHESAFIQFDHDGNGCVDIEEFKAEMKNMMLAVAKGIGFLPVQMVLEEDSFIKKAVDFESTKLAQLHNLYQS